jgi:hypothetical protein
MAISPMEHTDPYGWRRVVFRGECIHWDLPFISNVFHSEAFRGIAIDPESKFVYIGAESKNEIINALEIGQGSTLTFVSDQSFEGMANSNFLQVSPGGIYLYVRNQHTSTVCTFGINPKSARLTRQHVAKMILPPTHRLWFLLFPTLRKYL